MTTMIVCSRISSLLPSLPTNGRKIERRSANRKWRNFAISDGRLKCQENIKELSFNFRDEYHEQKVQDLRSFLEASAADEFINDPMGSLILVDEIQRLDLDYHFQEQIKALLKRHYLATKPCDYEYCSLHHATLSFRLFRQEGHDVDADIFTHFKGKDGRFKQTFDIIGLMELYEASQLCLEGEEILDEAANFSRQILHELALTSKMDQSISKIIGHNLKHPTHRSMARLNSNDFAFHFKGTSYGLGRKLKELVRSDVWMRKALYTQELHQLSEWWKDLGLAEELKLARNQPVKWYTWSIAALNDPYFGEERIQLTKCISFIYIIDDIYDVYGTPQNLVLFTEAINRWEYAAMDMLPDYMKVCYKSLLDTTNEISYWIYKKHGTNPTDTLRAAWTTLCNAFLVEAKWFASGELPTVIDYFKNAKLSCGAHIVLIVSFFLLGISPTTPNSIHLNDTSELISSVATILRLYDDLGSAKDEHQDGGDGSYIDCYMKENGGISFDDGRNRVLDMISSEWKRLNKEYFHLNRSSSTSSFAKAALNLARIVPLMYSYDENQRLPFLDEYVNSVLFDDSKKKHSIED